MFHAVLSAARNDGTVLWAKVMGMAVVVLVKLGKRDQQLSLTGI